VPRALTVVAEVSITPDVSNRPSRHSVVPWSKRPGAAATLSTLPRMARPWQPLGGPCYTGAMRSTALVGALLVLSASTGCMTRVSPPYLTLERTLLPVLGVPPDKIAETYATEVRIRPPVSAGLAWMEAGLDEYHRTGVLETALAELRHPPFSEVTSMPTSTVRRDRDRVDTVDALRGAAARFQRDVALLLQTGVADGSGVNLLSLAYLALVPIAFVPGNGISLGASAEICALDARSGIMLGCARGRSQRERRYVLSASVERERRELEEQALREAVAAAARDLRREVAARLAR
jgi:hypothetical protein